MMSWSKREVSCRECFGLFKALITMELYMYNISSHCNGHNKLMIMIEEKMVVEQT